MRKQPMEKKELTSNPRMDFHATINQLRDERVELRVKMHLAHCEIRREWEKAEKKWERLQAIDGHPLNTSQQLAQELKDVYIRIYRGLLQKSSRFLNQLDSIRQETIPEENAAFAALRRHAAAELTAIRLRLETLAGAKLESLPPAEAEPVCACLKCQPQELGSLLAGNKAET